MSNGIGQGSISQFLKTSSLILLPAFGVILLIAASWTFLDLEVAFLTRDSTAVAGVHPLAGALSNLGMLAWCTAAVICLFAAVYFHHRGYQPIYRFFLFSFLLAAYLLLDDLFLVHEYLAPEYLGISEKVVFGSIGIYTLGYLFAFRKIILVTEYRILMLAFTLLALSVLTDKLLAPAETDRFMVNLQYLTEDGLKWLGIVVFCAYYLRTTFHFLISEESLAVAERAGDAHSETSLVYLFSSSPSKASR